MKPLLRNGKILMIAAAIVWTGCSSDLVREENLSDKGCTLTIEATKGETALTRGLTNDLKAIWSDGDQVIILSAAGTKIGTMLPIETGSNITRLKATLDAPVSTGDRLKLVFPRIGSDYTGQIGTLGDIADRYDYATADVEVTYANPTFVTATNAYFKNHQAIVRFTLKKENNDLLPVKSLTISADGLIQNGTTKGPITITPTNPASEIFAALCGINGKVTVTASDGNNTYSYTTPNAKTLTNGKFYPATLILHKEPVIYSRPLTFECPKGIKCSVNVSNYGDLEYYASYDDDHTWKKYDEFVGQIDMTEGQWVSFRGNNSTMTTSSEYMNIQSSNKCYVYGNVMSLLSKEDFATMTTLPYEHTFQNLFMDNIHITSYESDNSSLDENKILVLPATTLKSYCYYQMFCGCLNLNYIKCLATKIPEDEEFCTYNWLYNAGRTILDNDGKCTFVKSADATFNWPRSDSGIPVGWDVKTE